MQAGEKTRRLCEWCNLEFDVVLEPKINQMRVNTPSELRAKDSAIAEIGEQKVTHCPFCGKEV